MPEPVLVPSPQDPHHRRGKHGRSKWVGPLPNISGKPRLYSSENNALLVRLKEWEGMSWLEIAQHFPGQNVSLLQVHYSTKLQNKAVPCSRNRRRRWEWKSWHDFLRVLIARNPVSQRWHSLSQLDSFILEVSSSCTFFTPLYLALHTKWRQTWEVSSTSNQIEPSRDASNTTNSRPNLFLRAFDLGVLTRYCGPRSGCLYSLLPVRVAWEEKKKKARQAEHSDYRKELL